MFANIDWRSFQIHRKIYHLTVCTILQNESMTKNSYLTKNPIWYLHNNQNTKATQSDTPTLCLLHNCTHLSPDPIFIISFFQQKTASQCFLIQIRAFFLPSFFYFHPVASYSYTLCLSFLYGFLCLLLKWLVSQKYHIVVDNIHTHTCTWNVSSHIPCTTLSSFYLYLSHKYNHFYAYICVWFPLFYLLFVCDDSIAIFSCCFGKFVCVCGS